MAKVDVQSKKQELLSGNLIGYAGLASTASQASKSSSFYKKFGSNALKAETASIPKETYTESSVGSLEELFSYAKSYLGSPHLRPALVMQYGESKAIEMAQKAAGTNKEPIDCSGFAQRVLGAAGVDPPGDQSAEGLYNYFKGYGTELKKPEKGALIFFEPINKVPAEAGTWDAGRKITHVGFAAGNNQILDSSGGRGVTQRSFKQSPNYIYHYIMPHYKFKGGSNV